MINDATQAEKGRNNLEVRPKDIETLAGSLAKWFVRLDGKYYDVREPRTKLSMIDVQRASLHRFKEAHPEIILSSPLLKEVFNLAIHQIHGNPNLSIQVWNGRRRCVPT